MNLRIRRLQERKSIQLSIVAGSILTIWAIVVGILGDSKAIIFDALYSMIGIGLSWVSLLVNNFIRKPDDKSHPFGRFHFQPFAITVQSSVIICLCLYTLATSVIDISKGGTSIELDVTLPYLIVSVGVSLFFWLYFRKQAKIIASEYIRIESTEWQMNTFLNLGVLVGMSMAYFLHTTSWAIIIPYIDSSMVIIISLLFLRIPLHTFLKNLRELLQFAPEDQVSELIRKRSYDIAQKYQYLETIVRVTKTGNCYTVEINFLLPSLQAYTPLSQLDIVRQELYDLIKGDYEMWLTISFTTERKWIF